MYDLKLLFFYLFIIFEIYAKVIYHCVEESLSNSICLIIKVDLFGNIVYNLKQCSVNEHCQIIGNGTDINTIGLCVSNIKKLKDKEICSRSSQCSSGFCSNHRCIGQDHKFYCVQGDYSCRGSLTCQQNYELTYFNEYQIFTCDIPLQPGEQCFSSSECDINLVCGYFKGKTFKTCIERASLKNGEFSDEKMACESGTIEEVEGKYICASREYIINNCNNGNYCNISVNVGNNAMILTKKCEPSSLGEMLCPGDQQEKYWKDYLKEWNKFYIDNDIKTALKEQNFNIEAYKNTLNNRDISLLFWKYNQWYYALDADDCARDFFFLNSKENYIIMNKIIMLIWTVVFFL